MIAIALHLKTTVHGRSKNQHHGSTYVNQPETKGMEQSQDKALVERAVSLVYQRIYYPLSRHGGTTRRQQFIDTEKEWLQPLPHGCYHMRQYKRAKVQKTCHIYLSEDRNYYSVPYRYQGLHVEVQYNQDNVEIFYNHSSIASHKRSFKPGHYTTVADHMPSSHQAYNSWSPQFFEDKAAHIGPYPHLRAC